MPYAKYKPEHPLERYGRYYHRTLGVVLVACELIRLPISIIVFNQKWTAESCCKRYWRPGIVWGFAKTIGGIYKWEIIALLGYSLPQILQLSNDVRLRLSSMERRARRSLLHRRKWQRIPEVPAGSLTDEYTGAELYRYEPLESSDKEIRLLHLHPGVMDDQVSVTMSYASSQERPCYLALSYVWGEGAKRTHPISVNGRLLHVTKSLLQALEHLRNLQGPDAEVPLRVDALCIDQDNDSEKSHQVRLMKEIYSQAYKVLVWLVPPPEDSELALAKMRAVEAWWYINMHSNEPVIEGLDEFEKDQQETDKKGAAARKPSSEYDPIMFIYEEYDVKDSASLEAIIDFLENPWWGRAWIAQVVSSPTSHSTPLGNVELVLGRQLQTISFRSTVMLLVKG